MTKPDINDDYIQYRKKIGRIHSQIELTEEWYLGSYMRVYEYLIPYITARFKSRPKKLAKVLVALNRIITFDSIIVIEAYREANQFLRVATISDAMDEVTKIDEVGNLLNVVDETITEANEVNAATRQLSTDIHDLSNTVKDASKEADFMVEKAGESEEIVSTSLKAFLSMIDEFKQSKENFQQFASKIGNISEVVDFIKRIADEVRKLAEQTKKSVETITDEMQEIQNDSVKVTNEFEQFSKNIINGVDQTKVSMEATNNIMEHIDQVNNAIQNIAIFNEKEAKSTAIISDKMNKLNDYFENTKRMTNETGKTVYKAGDGVNTIRKDSLQSITTFTADQDQRIRTTEERAKAWLTYNEGYGFHS